MSEPKNKPPEGGGEPVPTVQERLTPVRLAELTGNLTYSHPARTSAANANGDPKAAYCLADYLTARGVSSADEARDHGCAFSALHAAAAQLHGWAAHEHHGKEPFTLTIDQYKAALDAAGKGGAPHAPACSEHLPEAHKAAAKAAAEAAKAEKGTK